MAYLIYYRKTNVWLHYFVQYGKKSKYESLCIMNQPLKWNFRIHSHTATHI